VLRATLPSSVHSVLRHLSSDLIATGYRFESQPAFPFTRGSADLAWRCGLSPGRGPTKEITKMFEATTTGRGFGRSVARAGVIAASMIAGLSSAMAGSCPADKVKDNAREPVTLAAKGVTDTTL